MGTGIEHITGIVIDTLRHSDRYNVVTLFTRERGRMAFLSSASGGKTGRMRNARLLPLSVVESEVKIKGNRDMQILGAVAPHAVWRNLYFDPAKSSIVMFLADFLNSFLRQSSPDAALWDYIYASLLSLDSTMEMVANRHIAFLIGLLPHAGIQPDLRGWRTDTRLWLDMREGVVTGIMPLHNDILSEEDTRMLPMLLRMTAANSHKYRLTGLQRRRCLNMLLRYYAVHYPGLDNLKSLSILNELFS